MRRGSRLQREPDFGAASGEDDDADDSVQVKLTTCGDEFPAASYWNQYLNPSWNAGMPPMFTPPAFDGPMPPPALSFSYGFGFPPPFIPFLAPQRLFGCTTTV